MAKGNAGNPNAGRKPGGEGLPYKDCASVVGGEPENQIIGNNVGATSFGYKGTSSQQNPVKESSKLPPGKAGSPKGA